MNELSGGAQIELLFDMLAVGIDSPHIHFQPACDFAGGHAVTKELEDLQFTNAEQSGGAG
jgi:hypothetical protein